MISFGNATSSHSGLIPLKTSYKPVSTGVENAGNFDWRLDPKLPVCLFALPGRVLNCSVEKGQVRLNSRAFTVISGKLWVKNR